MATFISRNKRFNNGICEFNNYILNTENQKLIDRLLKSKQNEIFYKLWDSEKEGTTVPTEYIPKDKTSITWEELEVYKEKKMEKELFAGDDVQKIADTLIKCKYQELIADFMRSFNIKVTKLDKITLKDLLISNIRNNKISRYELSKFYNRGHRQLTEEQYAKLKEENDGNYINEIIQ